jgi:hypothetical protein
MYYPFDEDRAGALRGRHETSDASEYLLPAPEVVSVARDVLSEAEYREAEEAANKLTGNKRAKDSARARLVDLVKPPPKRPIYYAQHEIQYFPRRTGNALRYLGDFVAHSPADNTAVHGMD